MKDRLIVSDNSCNTSCKVHKSMTESLPILQTRAVCFDQISFTKCVGSPLVVNVEKGYASQLFRSGTAVLCCGCAAEKQHASLPSFLPVLLPAIRLFNTILSRYCCGPGVTKNSRPPEWHFDHVCEESRIHHRSRSMSAPNCLEYRQVCRRHACANKFQNGPCSIAFSISTTTPLWSCSDRCSERSQ